MRPLYIVGTPRGKDNNCEGNHCNDEHDSLLKFDDLNSNETTDQMSVLLQVYYKIQETIFSKNIWQLSYSDSIADTLKPIYISEAYWLYIINKGWIYPTQFACGTYRKQVYQYVGY